MRSSNESCLVAHRGYPRCFPENTLPGYRCALRAGAGYVELDVQLTADHVPILHHDVDTQRMTGFPGSVLDMTVSQISRLEAHQPDRFGERFRGTRISTLREFSIFLSTWPHAAAFVEVKRDSLRRVGLERAADRVVDALAPARSRCTVISFDDGFVEHVRCTYGLSIGWVLPDWNADCERRARELAPDYLFCDHRLMPTAQERLWHGRWKWAVYVVDDPAVANRFLQRGVRLVETDAICELLGDPLLRERSRPNAPIR